MKILTTIDLLTLPSLETPPSGHVGFGAKADGLYQKIGTTETKLSVDGHTHTFASLTSKPTTLAGYGITDAANISHNHAGVYEPVFTKNTAFNKNFGTAAGTVSEGNHTHTFASLTSKPTTLVGYGITDAYTKFEVDSNITVAINNLQIGWRNLITNRHSIIFYGADFPTYTAYNSELNAKGERENTVTTILGQGTPYSYRYVFIQPYYSIFPRASKYVYSFDYKTNHDGGKIQIDIRNGDNTNVLEFSFNAPNTNGEWRRGYVICDWTGKTTQSSSLAVLLPSDSAIGNYISIRNIKLVEGTKGWDDSPAPEDVQAAIDLKANIDSPIFTGTVTAPTFSGNLIGNASTATVATKLGTVTVGGVVTPFYLNAGVPTAFTTTVGSATLPVYMNAGSITACTSFGGLTGIGTATPLMDGTAEIGTSTLAARQDHIHPTDTSRAAVGQTMYIGTTAVAINRASGTLNLAGIGSLAMGGALTGVTTLTASTSVTVPKVIFAAAGWSVEQTGTEIQFKYNGVIKQRLLSDGSIVAVGEVTAYGATS